VGDTLALTAARQETWRSLETRWSIAALFYF